MAQLDLTEHFLVLSANTISLSLSDIFRKVIGPKADVILTPNVSFYSFE